MKNQYVGDIIDYITYGILRILADPEHYLTLGVIWMLTPDDQGRDGGKLSYLDAPDRWRPYDPVLYDVMSRIIDAGDRNVRAVEECGILPGVPFHGDPVPLDRERRPLFLDQALDRMRGCDIVFLAQDTGLEIPSLPMGRKNSDKYLYYSEVARAYGQGHSLLLYQHFPRVRRDDYLARRASELRQATGAVSVYAITIGHSCFFLVAREVHAPILAQRLGELAARWGDVLDIRTLPII